MSASHRNKYTICYGLICVSPKYVEVLTLSTLECDLVRKYSLYSGNQVKMRSSQWTLIQYDWYLYRKGKFHRHTDTQRETMWRHREKTDI